MYLKNIWKNLSDDKVREIELNPTFRVFLIKFWIRNYIEYKSLLDEKERAICIEEYINYLREQNSVSYKHLF